MESPATMTAAASTDTTPGHPLRLPELLAPAGSWECARAAVENGADAIYFGLERFNARMRAENFTQADLPKLMSWLHGRGVKGYVTLNTLIFQAELAEVEAYLRCLIAAGVDAAIVQDVGLCRLIRHLSPDFPIHASTQMTITSAAGVEFAKNLGCQLVVLARECSLKEIQQIQRQLGDRGLSLPLEVFVHGALCVAYSGQCLTSESLGGRSANRGECAQACRMTYDLIADGKRVDLGDRHYLLSPQDLAGLPLLSEILATGVHCLKIEGRLKAPEYVANVTRVYRQALDQLLGLSPAEGNELASANIAFLHSSEAHYQLEMAFSRGLYTGWFGGIDNQALVHARFAKKRGVYLGQVSRVQGDRVTVQAQAPIKPGDGIVFEAKFSNGKEQGGRVYQVEQQGNATRLTFGRGIIDGRLIQVGDRLWKTSDPELERQLRQTYAGETPRFQRPITIEVWGKVGTPMGAIALTPEGHSFTVESEMPLIAAQQRPLTTATLQAQFGRLGNTPFRLGTLVNRLQGESLLPVSELNRMRRALVTGLEQLLAQPSSWQLRDNVNYRDLLPDLPLAVPNIQPELVVLVRNLEQLAVAIAAGCRTLYCELEDPRRYKLAVQQVRQADPTVTLWVAPPRISKPGETWILEQVRACQADGYLVRNYDHLAFFVADRCIGDFSLNITNALTAGYFKQQFGLERLTASYDLNIHQLKDLLAHTPTDWLEVTIHQHMPMFHMEHCVFCAFLSEGSDFTNCGRPCEQHQVQLRDRAGVAHILQADAGCRNTVFNGIAQTGAEYLHQLVEAGVRYLRLEFVNETPAQVQQTMHCYQQLLQGKITGTQLWRELKLQNQIGVTRGAMGS